MHYLLLIHHDEARWRVLTAGEREMVEASLACDEEFRAAGEVLATGGIDPVTGSVVLERQDGYFVPVEGPVPGGAHLIRELAVIAARDLNDAVRIASRHPAATLDERFGVGIEIRRFDRFSPGTPEGGKRDSFLRGW
jgi:hypothetical protein